MLIYGIASVISEETGIIIITLEVQNMLALGECLGYLSGIINR